MDNYNYTYRDEGDSRKIFRFPVDEETPDFAVHAKLKTAISGSLKHCPLSRYQVAARMSEKLDSDVTKSMLDSWSAESKEWHRMPAEYIPAFCSATGCMDVMFVLAAPLQGVRLLETEDLIRVELLKAQQKVKEWQAYSAELKEKVDGTKKVKGS